VQPSNTQKPAYQVIATRPEAENNEIAHTKGQGHSAECGAEKQDGVADPEEIGVLHQSSVEEDEEQREQETVEAVVDVLRSGCLRIRETQVGQDARQDDE